MTPADQARVLLSDHGPQKAWQRATREAIDAHLRHDVERFGYWQTVQLELKRIAPRPGPGDLDVYRSAKLLINQHGFEEAARVAWQRGIELKGDLAGQSTWARIADAISALAQGHPDPECQPVR